MIWFKKYTLDELAAYTSRDCLVRLLDIKVTEIADDFICVTMPVDKRTHQVFGLLHGGATCVLVESAGSIASGLILDPRKQYSVGSQISVNHLRQIKDGTVIATCKPVHVGRSKHVWDIMVHSIETGKLIAKGELTCSVIDEPMAI